jgi:prepilin-type N-terminal cleavage/methylation domain-containing protein
MNRSRGRAGFTLVELLVVIAIIGVLVALLLPAIQAAREAARRLQCTNSQKQSGLGVLNFDSSKKTFPPGSTTIGTGIQDRQTSTWTVDILPYCEQMAIYRLWDPKTDFSSATNQKLRETFMPMYTCPVDIDMQQLVQPESGQGTGVFWAPGSYRGVSGTRWKGTSGSDFWDNPEANQANRDTDAELPSFTRGPLHSILLPSSGLAADLRKLPPVSTRMITDGTSNTLMIGEYMTLTVPVPGSPLSRRTMWAYSYTSYNQSSTMKTPGTFQPDFYRCQAPVAQGGFAADVNECKRAFGSLHIGNVCIFVKCDGSAIPVNQDIDSTVFAALGTIAGEEQISVNLP